MKKLIFALVLLLFVAAGAETITATTNAVSVAAPTNYGPIYNAYAINYGTNIVYARENVSVAGFVLTNSCPIPPMCAYNVTINEAAKPVSQVANMVIATDAGESLVYIGFHK